MKACLKDFACENTNLSITLGNLVLNLSAGLLGKVNANLGVGL